MADPWTVVRQTPAAPPNQQQQWKVVKQTPVQAATTPTPAGGDSFEQFGSGLISGLASIPEAMADAMSPGRSLAAAVTSRVTGEDEDKLLGPRLDLPTQLERGGVMAPMPSDPRGRATYNFGRNLGAAAPFAPFAGAVPILAGAVGGTAAGETAHAYAPDDPNLETIASLGGGLLGGAAAGGRPGGARTRQPTPARPPAPTNEALQQQMRAAYQRSKDAGVIIKPEALERFRQSVNETLADVAHHELDQPAVARLRKRIEDEAAGTTNGTTLEGLDTIKKAAGNAARDSQSPTERMMAGRIVEHYYDFLENLVPQRDTILTGQGTVEQAVSSLKEAVGLNKRLRKSEMIDQAIEMAGDRAATGGSGANWENSVRQNLRKILDKVTQKKLKIFTPAEVAQLRLAVRGGNFQNLMRVLGKFSPEHPYISGAAALAGGAVGGIPGAAVMPTIGFVAKPISEALATRNVNRLSEMVRRGPQTPARSTAPNSQPPAPGGSGSGGRQQPPMAPGPQSQIGATMYSNPLDPAAFKALFGRRGPQRPTTPNESAPPSRGPTGMMRPSRTTVTPPTETPTYNYVVFDDKLVSVLKKYAIPMTVLGTGAVLVASKDLPPDIKRQLNGT